VSWFLALHFNNITIIVCCLITVQFKSLMIIHMFLSYILHVIDE